MPGRRAVALAARRLRVLAVLLAPLAGCAQSNWSGPVYDDIVSLAQYPQPDPWIRNPDGQVVGVRVRLYLISSETGRGAFVPGTIDIKLDVITRQPDGNYAREQVYAWQFSEDSARDWRVVERSILGESYGLPLRWPAELNLAGREVQLLFSYTRRDGRVVTKAGSRLRVPLYRPGNVVDEPPPSPSPRAPRDSAQPADPPPARER